MRSMALCDGKLPCHKTGRFRGTIPTESSSCRALALRRCETFIMSTSDEAKALACSVRAGSAARNLTRDLTLLDFGANTI